MDPTSLSLKEATEDFLPNVVLIIVSGLLGVGAWLIYLIFVRFKLTFLHGYFGSPGPLIDDRYGFYWTLTTIDCARVVLFALYLFTLKNLISTWRKNWHRALNSLYIVYDVVLIIILWINSACCNNPFMPTNPCNDEDYCSVYGASYPDRCGDGPYTGSADDLKPNPTFVYWFWFTVGFLLLDLFQWFQVESLRVGVRRYIFSSGLLKK